MVTTTQVPWQSGDAYTIRHFGKLSSYACKKNRQTHVSLAMMMLDLNCKTTFYSLLNLFIVNLLC